MRDYYRDDFRAKLADEATTLNVHMRDVALDDSFMSTLSHRVDMRIVRLENELAALRNFRDKFSS